MGLELPKYPDMEEDDVVIFTDSEIVSHVKDALTSVLSVSTLTFFISIAFQFKIFTAYIYIYI